MQEYHKINSIYNRDSSKPNNPFIIGQYAQDSFEYLRNNEWEWQEKVDGTNIRIIYENHEIKFGGKTAAASIPAHLINSLQETFLTEPMKDKFRETFPEGNACIYGEGFGYKIQKVGGLYLGTVTDFYTFDVKIGQWWLQTGDVTAIANFLGIRPPIILGHGTLDAAIAYVQTKPMSTIGTAPMEGLVLRPMCQMLNRSGSRIITKVKVKDF